MLNVFLVVVGEYQNVIQINEYKCIQHPSENIINKGLEYGWGIDQAKWHYLVFVVANRGVEWRLPLVYLTNPEYMVCVMKIQFSKDGATLQNHESHGPERKRVLVLDGNTA